MDLSKELSKLKAGKPYYIKTDGYGTRIYVCRIGRNCYHITNKGYWSKANTLLIFERNGYTV